MTTLVTFIGRTEANRAYKVARYRFQDGSVSESSLFAAAALADLRRAGRMPKRLVAIGTPTSGWDVLLELVARLAPDAQEEALQWAVPVSDSLERGPVEASQLRDFEQRFSSRLGLDIKLRLASNDGDSVFGALAESLEQGASVTLDITHSFRSMPVHALVALGAMRWLKGVDIVDILYGSLDERSTDGVSAARSLKDTARLARATPSLAQLDLVGDVGGVAHFFESTDSALAARLRDTQRLETLMQYARSSTPRGQALGTLRTLATKTPVEAERACALRTIDTLKALHHGDGAIGLRNRAEAALARGDLMRALGLANEALLLRVIELCDLRDKAQQEYDDAPAYDRNYYAILNRLAREGLKKRTQEPGAPYRPRRSAGEQLKTLNELRNAVMHAGCEATGQQVPDEIQSLEKLTDLIQWSFEFYGFLGEADSKVARSIPKPPPSSSHT